MMTASAANADGRWNKTDATPPNKKFVREIVSYKDRNVKRQRSAKVKSFYIYQESKDKKSASISGPLARWKVIWFLMFANKRQPYFQITNGRKLG